MLKHACDALCKTNTNCCNIYCRNGNCTTTWTQGSVCYTNQCFTGYCCETYGKTHGYCNYDSSCLARSDLCGRFPGSPACSGFVIGGNPDKAKIPTSGSPPADFLNFPPKYSKPSLPPIPSGQPMSSPLNSPTRQTMPMNPNAPFGGIPSGGMVGPLAGLGGSPAMAPQFGGPVNGGLGVGQSLYSPFFGYNSGTNIVPTQGVMSGSNYNIAGMGVGAMNSVNFGGLPGLSYLNNRLGIPMNSGMGMGGLGNMGGFGNMGNFGNMGGLGSMGSFGGFG